MAGIPPTGGPSGPTPSQEPTNILANKLGATTGRFVEETYHILRSPHLADNPETLRNYAQTILDLNQAAGEIR